MSHTGSGPYGMLGSKYLRNAMWHHTIGSVHLGIGDTAGSQTARVDKLRRIPLRTSNLFFRSCSHGETLDNSLMSLTDLAIHPVDTGCVFSVLSGVYDWARPCRILSDTYATIQLTSERNTAYFAMI